MNKHISSAIVRIIIGGIFIMTGWLKVSAMATTLGYFGGMGIPAFLAYAVSYIELVGGVLIVLGLWTELAASVLAVIMIFAIYFSRGFGMQGMMPPLAVFAGLISLMGSGAGKYAVFSKKSGSTAVSE